MDINLLKQVLEIPTCYEHQKRMVDFLMGWGIKNHIPVIVDVYGNVYLKKGQLSEGEYYPCVMAHIDTVQRHTELVEQDLKLNIHESTVNNKTILTATTPLGRLSRDTDETVYHTGIGGDDKAGVAICLEIILQTNKIIGAFFLNEEIGCLGAKKADDIIFSEVGYAMEFDAPGSDWLSYVSHRTQLFNKSFFKLIDPILLKYGIANIRDCDPFTDIYVIKRKFDFNCMNFFAGYYRWHSDEEYVVYEDAIKAANLGKELIQLLGNQKYEFIHNKQIEPMANVIFD